VVTAGVVPDNSVIAGVPARVVRRHEPGAGWVSVADKDG
jgi:acetyltransferase-like isoleucine patch superfamily enzyme